MKGIIINNERMRQVDWASIVSPLISDLREVYKEDFNKILESLDIPTEDAENLNLTTEQISKIQHFHRDQFDEGKQINKPWLDRFIGDFELN